MTSVIDFIKERHGGTGIDKARRQQKQLSYFTQSDIQEDITVYYLDEWANRNFITEDYFLNFVKMLFRTENFLSFYKYYRYPAASAELVQDRIKPQLERVFFSEDSYFKYKLKGKDIACPENLSSDKFNSWMLNNILFNYNDILIYDFEDVNKPYRQLVCIDDVVAIDSDYGKIQRIAYSAEIEYIDEKGNEVEVYGYAYLDSERYVFFDKELRTELYNIPHDLGECPADYIVPEKLKDKDVVRKSLFSYVRPKLEEYVFLKTLQRMSDAAGALPVTVKLKTTENKKDSTITNEFEALPMAAGVVPKKTDSALQAGTEISVPAKPDAEGRINMDIVQNFFKFYHFPVEVLEYLDKRIDKIEQSILVTLVGDFSESNESAKNELQTGKGYDNKQDKLRQLSHILSRIRTISDFKMMALQYGRESVFVDCFYGSDFFLQTEEDLYEMFGKSPNTLERKNILVKLSSTRNKFNPDRAKKEKILYDLMPFVSDKDFGYVQTTLDPITLQYQTRFNYWISMFEAQYGDIVEVWDGMVEMANSEKLIIINNLVAQNIKDYVKTNSSSAPNPDQGGENP